MVKLIPIIEGERMLKIRTLIEDLIEDVIIEEEKEVYLCRFYLFLKKEWFETRGEYTYDIIKENMEEWLRTEEERILKDGLEDEVFDCNFKKCDLLKSKILTIKYKELINE